MFRMIKFLLTLCAIAIFIWFGMTVPLGNHTLFGHVKRIWRSDETRDLWNGAKEAAKPAADKVKRTVDRGVDEAKRNP